LRSASVAKPSIRLMAPGLLLAQRRFVSTEPMTAPDNIALLNAQRTHRPTSPHLAIYQPQITWLLSGLNRITGVALSGVLYGASLLYLLHPMFPVIDSAHAVSLAASMPVWLKGGLKLIFALPFTFHTFNGVRHLLWDVGQGLTLKGVYAGGYTVLALTAVSSIYLAFFV